MDLYDFESGLAQIERLEVLIASPFLHLLKDLLPDYGMRTKPSLAEPAALLVVGAATVIYEGDRSANRELRVQWPRLRAAFRKAGMRVPHQPLNSQHFRDYRDKVLGEALPEPFKEEARVLAVGQALQMGRFPDVNSPWDEPLLSQTICADGTRSNAASEVRNRSTSRSIHGRPRVVADADRWTKAWGYNFCIVTARGEDPRDRVILDVVRAPDSAEMSVVVPAALALREKIGSGFRCFVYDGAMRGKAHTALRLSGVLSVNKPRGTRRPNEWKAQRNSKVGEDAKIVYLDTGCTQDHPLTVTVGMLWEVSEHPLGGHVRGRVVELTGVRLLPERTEADVVIRCALGHHRVTIDANATLSALTYRVWSVRGRGTKSGRAMVNLADDLRLLQINNEEQFAKVYGRRNDAESGNNTLKFDFGLGDRSRSYTAKRLDTDLWILMLLLNSLAWREYCQKSRWEHSKALNRRRRRVA